MEHRCFISFKTEDSHYKEYIQNELEVDYIDKSLNEPIDSEDEDYIMRKIREDYLKDSTVTIHLIGNFSAENSYGENQNFIKRELQASLYSGDGNTKNGILGVVIPEATDNIFKGKYSCSTCGSTHNNVDISNNTTVREFNYNYYIPKSEGCAWSEDDRYCILVKWDDFINKPNYFIDQAFDKRTAPISKKTKVRPT